MKLIAEVLGMGAVIMFTLTASGFYQDGEDVVVQEPIDLDKKFTRYMVKLDAKWSSDTLIVQKVGKCKKHNHDGCLLFEENHEGSITFYLNSSSNWKTCEKNAGEVITRVELATAGKTDDPAKGDFSERRDDWIKVYAFETINLEDGVVFEAPWETASTHVTLKNLNNQPAEMGEKQFWYKVTVTSCSEPSRHIATDPRGDNEGKH